MKKIYFTIIFSIISLIPIIKVNATTNLTNVDTNFTNHTTSFMNWVYNTSHDYLLSQIEDYDYKFIQIICGQTATTNIYSCEIIVVGSSIEGKIISRYRSGYTSGIYYQQPINYQLRYNDLYFNINQPNNVYTDYNLSNQINEITDNNIKDEATNKTNIILIFNALNSSSSSSNYNVYYTNNTIISAGASYDRTISIYNENSELLTTASVGDVLPSYVSLYNSIPSYLTNYEKVGLTPSNNNLIISNVSKGSIYISVEDFNKCNGLFGYFDKELSTQPYSSIITEYTRTLDGLYIRQDFDLSSYVGADYVYYQKCQYVEGEDNINKFIWVPDSSYTSPITSTENNTGGLDYNYKVEENGEIVENTFSSLDNILDSTNPLLNTLFSDFSTNYFGISSIVTAPLSLINQLSSSTCSPLVLPLPHSNKNLVLPCMNEIYEENFGQLFNLYQFLLLGFVSYRLAVAFFYDVKKLKDPNNDEVEVMNL